MHASTAQSETRVAGSFTMARTVSAVNGPPWRSIQLSSPRDIVRPWPYFSSIIAVITARPSG